MTNQLSFEEWFDRNVRGLPEDKVRKERSWSIQATCPGCDRMVYPFNHVCDEFDPNDSEIDPFEEDENSQDYFQRQTICQGCQRLIDPKNHVCEGLQPRFYLEDLVDWDEAPPHANWAAQDANGVIWFYGTKPFLSDSGAWAGTGSTFYRFSVAQAIDWKKPLPRPKENYELNFLAGRGMGKTTANFNVVKNTIDQIQCRESILNFYLEELIDFSKLPEWTNYVAQDDDGVIVAYEKPPVKRNNDGMWDEGGRFYLLWQADCLALDQHKPLKLKKEVKFKPVYNE